MHAVLYALSHHLAGDLVRVVDVAVEVIVVRAAPAAAYVLREAAVAFFAGEQAGIAELRADLFVELSFKDAAHAEISVPRKLMAGIDIPVRHDGKILVARAAGGNALGEAGPALEVYVEVEKIEPLPFRFVFEVFVAQNVVFFADARNDHIESTS